jgi:hypothetical protein
MTFTTLLLLLLLLLPLLPLLLLLLLLLLPLAAASTAAASCVNAANPTLLSKLLLITTLKPSCWAHLAKPHARSKPPTTDGFITTATKPDPAAKPKPSRLLLLLPLLCNSAAAGPSMICCGPTKPSSRDSSAATAMPVSA